MELTGHEVVNEADVPSPSLLIYPERIDENIRRMVELVGGDADRLWPHVKTHKLDAVIHSQLEHGIDSFKCATLAEAEMVATTAGPVSVLLAMQPVGPNVDRLADLVEAYPITDFSTIVDNEQSVRELSAAFTEIGQTLKIFIDIDCGMQRTGIAPENAADLYYAVHALPAVTPIGLHVYDGHIHDGDLETRRRRCAEAMAPVGELAAKLESEGLDSPIIVGGGTPTFPIHAKDFPDHYCSPGTCLLWDYGYGTNFEDMEFLPAALVLTRVVSKPGAGLLCLDLGHKAIASENPHPKRVRLIDFPDAAFVTHSEEHLVIRTERADTVDIGQVVYGVPWHICPTVALHCEAVVVKDGVAVEQWMITARDRQLSI